LRKAAIRRVAADLREDKGEIRSSADLFRRSFAFLEAHDAGEADFTGHGVGLVEAKGHFARCVGIGIDDDGDLAFVRGDEEIAARVDFTDVLAQAGGVDFEHGAGLGHGVEGGQVKPGEIAFGPMAEFLDEVGVGEKIEEAALDHFSVGVEIGLPDLLDRLLAPALEVLGVVDIPVGRDVVDGADEVIPLGLGGEVADVAFVAGNEVALEAETDGVMREFAADLGDKLEVFGELAGAHAPVVELSGHGVVVGEADLGQAALLRGENVVARGADGVAAEWRVEMIIRAHSLN
jgi:hypothetical protein